jgi:hypothetical protein
MRIQGGAAYGLRRVVERGVVCYQNFIRIMFFIEIIWWLRVYNWRAALGQTPPQLGNAPTTPNSPTLTINLPQ